MTLPELDQFQAELRDLKYHPAIAGARDGEVVRLGNLSLVQISSLLKFEAGHYFLLAASGLNRTSLKKAIVEPEAKVVAPKLRRSYAVSARLPVRVEFGQVESQAVALRRQDLQRRARGQIEQLFRDRLELEGIPLLMSPPIRIVPGVLIGRRKPDGVWPDPASGQPPEVYLEVKNIRRVADDIQKRLYELAEASLEMKLLYGRVELRGLGLTDTGQATTAKSRSAIRAQIVRQRPVVIGLLICSP